MAKLGWYSKFYMILSLKKIEQEKKIHRKFSFSISHTMFRNYKSLSCAKFSALTEV